jgi:hypothetical protein
VELLRQFADGHGGSWNCSGMLFFAVFVKKGFKIKDFECSAKSRHIFNY